MPYLTVLGENVAFVISSGTGFQEIWMLMNEAKNTWVKSFSFLEKPRLLRVDFRFWGLWMNKLDLYGMRKIHKKQVEGGSENRCLSYTIQGLIYTLSSNSPLQMMWIPIALHLS